MAATARRFVPVCPAVFAMLVSAAVALAKEGEAKAELKPLLAPGRGTIKGKVVWTGCLPDISDLEKQLRQALMDRVPRYMWPKDGRIEQQRWRISPKKGFGNVMVYLMPPPGFFFPLGRDDLDPDKGGWRKDVVIEARDFNFQPHVAFLFPGGRDQDGKEVSTGQVFTIRSCLQVPHSARLFAVGADAAEKGFQRILPPGTQFTANIKPTRLPCILDCALHRWMRAWVRSLDHPYVAITDAEGSFEIRNVPAGVKMRIQAWHEETGWLSPNRRDGDEIEVPVGKVVEHTFKAFLRE